MRAEDTGLDLDELADLARTFEKQPALLDAAESLRRWFADQGLDMTEFGGGDHLTEADAFEEWGPM